MSKHLSVGDKERENLKWLNEISELWNLLPLEVCICWLVDKRKFTMLEIRDVQVSLYLSGRHFVFYQCQMLIIAKYVSLNKFYPASKIMFICNTNKQYNLKVSWPFNSFHLIGKIRVWAKPHHHSDDGFFRIYKNVSHPTLWA